VRRRILYSADLHGSDRCFRKLLNSAKFYGVQDLLIGGDLTGKVVVPLVEGPDGTFSSKWLGREGMTASEAAEAEGHLTNAGLYHCRVSAAKMVELEASPDQVYELFNRLMRERLTAWLRLADERLRPLGVRLYVIPGNDDRLEMDAVMKQADQVIYCESEVVDLAGHELVSCGWTNISPWHTTRELPEEALEPKLEALASRLSRPERAIVNFHCPPEGTKLDFAPLLTKDFKYVGKGGALQVQHVGSTAVRRVIERHQPLLSLHGHIHESRAEDFVGRTLCLNPGSEYGEGILDAVIVQLDDEKVVGHQFTTG
jgi:uncharacterized protein